MHPLLHSFTATQAPAHLPSLLPGTTVPQVPGLGLRIDTTRLDLTYKSKYDVHLPGEEDTA